MTAKPSGSIVILGGGFAGAYCAQVLSEKAPSGWTVTVVDRNNFLVFYPLLIEAGVGSLEPRHVVAPIRSFAPKAEFHMAEVAGVDLQAKRVDLFVPEIGEKRSLSYDHLVLALGSVTKLPDVPGLQEYGFQIKGIKDAVSLRDRGIRLLEIASQIENTAARRELLRFVVVGSNLTGTEFVGEFHDFMTEAVKAYPMVDCSDIEFYLVEYADRILPVFDASLAMYADAILRKRGIKIATKTTIREMDESRAVLTNGETLMTKTVVWCAGIEPSPAFEKISGLPLNERGYIKTGTDLRVEGLENVWAIGDGAAVMDPSGKRYAATAQNALRQGTRAGLNILASLAGRPLKPYEHEDLGTIAAIGKRRAVAEIFGFKLHGFLAWWMYRTVYLIKMPGFWRRMRLVFDWTIDLFLKGEPVQFGLHDDFRAHDAFKKP